MYTVRRGTTDSGKDYEIRMATLAALRCIQPDVIQASLAFNADGCSDFDDLVIYHKYNQHSHISLVQLKHQDKPKYLKSSDFLANKGNFALSKYAKGYSELQKDNFKELKKIFNDDKITHDEVELILYTNRDVDITGQTSSPCNFLKMHEKLHFLITNEGNSKVYGFNLDNSELAEFPQFFLKKLLLFVNQSNVREVNQLIRVEIGHLIPGAHNFITFNTVNNFIQFITSWTKGGLGGHFVLTKNQIMTELTRILLETSCTKFHNLTTKPSVEANAQIFDEIIADFDIILIRPFDDTVINILSAYKICSKWAPLTVVVDSDDFLSVLSILTCLKSDQKLLILTNDINLPIDSLQGMYKILTNLSNLSKVLQNLILSHDVKFQGRGPITLKEIVCNIPNGQKLILANDIIKILDDKFSIGDTLAPLPEFYISRTIPKLLLNCEVFTVTKDILFVACANKAQFKYFLEQKKLIQTCTLFDAHDDITAADLGSHTCLIVCSDKMPGKVLTRNTHYLNFQDDQIEWVKTCGSNKLRIYLTGINTNTPYNWLENVSNPYQFKNAINVISAGPGMGKSITMNVIALRTSLDKWVLRVDLNKYLNYFYELRKSKSSEHLEYFSRKLLVGCDTELNKILFKNFLDKKQIIVLFDGFDEIVPSYKDTITQVIQQLKNDNYQMWITTRPIMRLHIEQEFDTFAYTLNPFTEQNQLDFLNKYFMAHVESAAKDVTAEINTFAKELLELTRNNLGFNVHEIMGIPLQTRMLAEVYLKYCEDYLCTKQISKHDLDILFLYEQFVKLKECEFVSKFGRDYALRILKSSRDYHMLYALKILFETDNSCDALFKRFTDDVQDGSYNIGIVISLDEINLAFIHRTFAEYYAALWLSENYQDFNLQKIAEPGYELVRNFFDRLVTKELPLHTAVLNRNVAQVKNCILHSNRKDRLGRSALHLLCTWSTRFPIPKYDKTRDLNKDVTKEAEIAEMLIKTLDDPAVHAYIVENHCLGILNAYAKAGKQFNIANKWLDAYLYYCTEYGFVFLMNAILLKHPEVKIRINDLAVKGDYRYNCRYNLLHIATLACRQNIILLLIENGADINARGDDSSTTFHYAAQYSDDDTISLLLFKGADINARDFRNKTPLHKAAEKGNSETVKLLLAKGADVHAVASGSNALHFAAGSGDNKTIEQLLSYEINVNACNRNAGTALHYAAKCGNNEAIELLLKNGANINVRNNTKNTALHYAVKSGHNKTILLLLGKEADVKAKNEVGNTVLHYAAKNDNKEAVELLLHMGADVNESNEDNETALHCTAENGRLDTIKLLLAKGAKNVESKYGFNALHKAAKSDMSDTVKLLLSNGFNVNAMTTNGNTALHYAIGTGRSTTVKLLIANKANVNADGEYGNTTLHCAVRSGNYESVELLLSKGANVNASNHYGENPLHIAAKGNNYDVVKLLLCNAADVNATNKYGKSALHYAIKSDNYEIVKLLLCYRASIELRNDDYDNAVSIAVKLRRDNIVKLLYQE